MVVADDDDEVVFGGELVFPRGDCGGDAGCCGDVMVEVDGGDVWKEWACWFEVDFAF